MVDWIGLAAAMTLITAQAEPGSGLLGDPATAAAHDYCHGPEISAETLAGAELAVDPENANAAEPEQAAGLLILAGTRIAQAEASPRACARNFENGQRRFERVLARNTRTVGRNSRYETSDDPAIAGYQRRISELWVRDQAGRLTYVALRTDDRDGEAFWAQRLATANAVMTDHDSTELMRQVLVDYDWVDRVRFGARISSHAWILVQHADDHPEFQQVALARMEPYLESGGVNAREYAYLSDRVAVNTGQDQIYGTQPADQCNEDGSLDLKPVRDIDQLDERRAAMGLGPYRADLDRMASERCG